MEDFPPRKRHLEAPPERFARGLGWYSVGLGIAQVLAPRTVAQLMGLATPAPLMVLGGLSQIVNGVGLLTQDEPLPWLKARLTGDALDLAALGASTLAPGADRRRIAVAAAAVAGVAAADAWCARELTQRRRRLPPRQETIAIEIDLDAPTLYRYWRDLSNLPRVLPHVASVQEIDETQSHWISADSGGQRLEWDAEIIDDAPNERIAWRSVEGSSVFHAGSVQFRPTGERSTQVRVDLLYDRPPATLAAAVSTLFGFDPASAARTDLMEL